MWTPSTSRFSQQFVLPRRQALHRPQFQVWLDGASVSGSHVGYAFAHRRHLDAEFVAEHARVAEKRLPPPEGVEVRPAHSDTPDVYKGFAFS